MNNLCISLIAWISRRWLRLLITLLFVSTALWTYALGFSARNIANAAFSSLQFLVLNKEIAEINTSPVVVWGLIAMQFLLPVTASVGLINTLFYNQFDPFYAQLRLNLKKNHVVIIGCGPVGASISMAFCSKETPVIVIDKKPDNIYRSKVVEYNNYAIWLSADFTEAHILKAMKLEKSSKIFICTDDDNRNLDIFNKINSTISGIAKRPEIHIQLVSDAARDALKDSVGWLGLTAGLQYDNVSTFDLYELAAREIFNRYSPDKFSSTDENSDVSQTIIVVGSSNMAKALIRRAGQLGHYSADGKLKVIWVDPDVESVAKSLYAECPNLNPEVNPSEFSLPDDGADYKEILPSILIDTVSDYIGNVLRQEKYKFIFDQKTPAVVFVCNEDEAKNADYACEICAFYNRIQVFETGRSQHIVVAVQFDQKFGLSHHGFQTMNSLKCTHPHEGLAFKTEEISIIESIGALLADDLKDKLASYFNTVVYNKNDPSQCADEWRKLPELLKESNRDVADHIEIKLRKLIGPNTLMQKASEEDSRKVDGALANDFQLRDLSMIEHKRYCAFMFMAGYSYAPKKEHDFNNWPAGVSALEELLRDKSGVKNSKAEILKLKEKHWQRLVRVNPTLVAYNSLHNDEKVKDENIAKEISTAIKFVSLS